jgi:hypothetical protein
VQLAVPTGTNPPGPVGATTLTTLGSARYQTKVSKSGGVTGRTLVVSPMQDLGSSTDLFCVDQNFNVLGTLKVFSNTLVQQHDVDGDGTEWLVTMVSQGDLFCQKVRWNTVSQKLETTTGVIQLTNTPNVIESHPAVGLLGPKFLVAWTADAGVLEGDIHGIALDQATCVPCGKLFTTTTPNTHELRVEIATQFSSGPNGGDQALMVYGSFSRTAPFHGDVRGRRFGAYAGDGSFASLGGGCATGYKIGLSGEPGIGNSGFRFVLNETTPAVALFVLNAPTRAIPCGTCQVLPPALVLPGRPNASGAHLALAIPCDPSLIGGVLDTQWWILGSAQKPCSLTSDLVFSDIGRLKISE